MSRAGSAWSSRPRIWRCSPRWGRACGTARSRPTRRSWGRAGWAAGDGPWAAWGGGGRGRGRGRGGARGGRAGGGGGRVCPGGAAGGVVHAAPRPFVSRETIDGVIARAREGVGGVAAVPVSDTVKEVVENRQIVRTVPRERLWRTHTPQGFPRAMLEQAYARLGGNEAPTGRAEGCERAGAP